MIEKSLFYTDKDGEVWLRLGDRAVVYPDPGQRHAVYSWEEASKLWGPMILEKVRD